MTTTTVPMCAVVHFEMPYRDRERAARFYAAAFGWTHQFLGPQMGDYVLVNRGFVPAGRINSAAGTPLASDAGMEKINGKRDIAAAKKLVAESGYKGERVVLMSPSDLPSLQAIAQVTADLVNFNVNRNPWISSMILYKLGPGRLLFADRLSEVPPMPVPFQLPPVADNIRRAGATSGTFPTTAD